ncbi:uncharacterized protein LOC129296679 [Prosopis cineraria]|uniref:uncharacterized protein LOC129296679 n=1 Tax=Prosopis cineraria TaxID=364024 RepID=UPI00240EDCC6|nr:uncharacterized protein LOC129296679 [Prosopis cineraria]
MDGSPLSWSEFKRRFFSYYFPTSFRVEKEAEFYRLQQGNMNEEEFIAKFNELSKYSTYLRNHNDDDQRSAILSYVFAMIREEAEASLKLIHGMISLSNQQIYVLFDSGTTYSFVSNECAQRLKLHVVEMPFMMNVSTLAGASLSANRAMFDCIRKIVSLLVYMATTMNNKTTHFVPVTTLETPKFILVVQMEKSIKEGCQAFIVFCLIHGVYDGAIDKIGVVNKFPKVFADEVSGLPPKREIEFLIDLVPGTEPISKAPYRMAPTKLNELKKQLEELLEKGLIRPSVSH